MTVHCEDDFCEHCSADGVCIMESIDIETKALGGNVYGVCKAFKMNEHKMFEHNQRIHEKYENGGNKDE